ncbi:MAG: hypothetical protein KIT58_04955 [Planctomycetota bacterium]|nr:hypothetical protein [Planctomycetota bacterium]
MSEREGLTLERSAPLPARARRAPPPQDLTAARTWLALSLGTLLLAGLTAVLLVVGRLLPLLGVTSGGGFFRRCLVVHVDLALVVWFYAFLAGLVALLPCRRPAAGLSRAGAGVAALGVLLLLVGMYSTDAAPISAPVLDHPLHLVALRRDRPGGWSWLADDRLLPGREAPANKVPTQSRRPPSVDTPRGRRRQSLALATLVAAVAATPDGPPKRAGASSGPGHCPPGRQRLRQRRLGDPSCCRRWARRRPAAATSALSPCSSRRSSRAAPRRARGPADASPHHRLHEPHAFGDRAGAPGPARPLRARRGPRPPRRAAVEPLADARVARLRGLGVLQPVLGMCLGAAISGSNTVIPAHYHASVGGVTASFMALTYLLLEPLGAPIPARLRPLTRWQPLVYGAGQVVFAIGFAFSGLYGLARKAYGAEQVVRTTSETVGLAVMGLGGLVAVAGGALFITIVGAAWRARAADPAQEEVVA